MFNNYFKIALRYLIKSKLYTFINVLGLSVGITCFLFIFFYFLSEITYDSFHSNADKVYRVYTTGKSTNGTKEYAKNPFALAGVLGTSYNHAALITRLSFTELWISKDEKESKENVFFADKSFMEIFTFPLVSGNPQTALNNKNSTLITEEFARFFFGDINPVGKVLTLNNSEDFIISGVLKNLPPNSSIKFKILIPVSNIETFTYEGIQESWNDWGTYIYLKFFDGYKPSDISKDFDGIVDKFAPEYLKEGKMSFGFQSLKDIHLNSLELEIKEGNTEDFLYSLLLIGLLILFISIINFINLATARSSERIKEISVRKILGAKDKQVSYQFLTEAIVLSFISVIIAVIAVNLFLPEYNSFIGKEIVIDFLNPIMLPILLIFSILLGLIAGSYPAIFLSRFSPLQLFSTKISGKSKKLFREVLIIIQFGISIFLIICQFTISGQISYMKESDLGFNNKGQIIIPLQTSSIVDPLPKMELLINKLRENSNIKSVSISQNVPGKHFQNYWEVIPEKQVGESNPRMYVSYVDEKFINTYGIKILAGRNFSEEFATDPYLTTVINNQAAKDLGLKPDEAINKTFSFKHMSDPIKIIGVTDDFHYKSLLNEIEPLIMLYDSQRYYSRYITADIGNINIVSDTKILNDTWKEVIQEIPFEYTTIENIYNGDYLTDDKTANAIRSFSIVAFALACMGLFSLSAYIANKKTKEIGIRKVVGASVLDIVFLLSKEFAWLIIIANVLAWPISKYIMQSWLDNYPYRIKMELSIFILSGIIAIAIALLTISIHSVKAAFENPINAIKYE